MNCLCCEKEIEKKLRISVHPRCVRKLFGSNAVPAIPFGYVDIQHEAQKLIGKMSISGVQPKLSVAVNKRTKCLEVVAAGGTHILKPSPETFPFLSENENFYMNLACEMAIETPPHGLVRMNDGRLAYLVRRFDRDKDGKKIHVEDFSQLLGKTDKYQGSVEQIGKYLKHHSSIPFIDTQKLFVRVLFFFLIGNGDAHLKNFAMVSLPSGPRLAPAYDIVSSRIALPAEKDDMALSMNGRKNRIDMRDFQSLADSLEINEKRRDQLIESAHLLDTKINAALGNSFLPEAWKKKVMSVWKERIKQLTTPVSRSMSF